MGYVVYGAGAIGGLVGGRLFEAGFDVTLIARGPHLDALRARGLRLESPSGSATLPVPAVGHPREVEWDADHVVLMAVKSHQTAPALVELATVAPVGTPIACLQNGIANEPAALRLFPHVQGVCVMCPASHLEPGVVRAWSTPVAGLLDIGRYPDGSDQVTRSIAADLSGASFSSRPVPDIRRWKHRKLLTNLGNAVEAICGRHEQTGPITAMLVAEGEAALRAAGLEACTAEEDRSRRADLLQLGEIGGSSRPGGSSWQSLRRNAGDIETDYLNGEVVLLGRMHGVPTPANEVVQQLAQVTASNRASPGAIPAATILGLIERSHQTV